MIHEVIYYGALFLVLFVSIAICLVQFERARRSGDPFRPLKTDDWNCRR